MSAQQVREGGGRCGPVTAPYPESLAAWCQNLRGKPRGEQRPYVVRAGTGGGEPCPTPSGACLCVEVVSGVAHSSTGPRAHLARGRSAQDEVHALREPRGCPGPLFPAGRSSPPRDTFPSQFRLHPPQPGGCPVRSCPWALLWALLRAPLVGDQICYCFFYWISPNWLQVLSREVLGAAFPLPFFNYVFIDCRERGGGRKRKR